MWLKKTIADPRWLKYEKMYIVEDYGNGLVNHILQNFSGTKKLVEGEWMMTIFNYSFKRFEIYKMI